MTRSSESRSTPTDVQSTPTAPARLPLVLYSKRTLGAGFTELVEQRLAAALKGLGSRVERLTARFEDLNGPKGGVDTACRLQLSLSGHRLLVVEGRAEDEARAFRVALPRLISALDRQLNRRAEIPRKSLRQPFARAS